MVRSDEDLLTAAARDGDAEAFAVFYRRHASAVTAFHRRRVPTPELAFDLTAETFAALVGALDRFDPARGTARGWLFAIAANEWRQALRRLQVEDRARRALALEPIVLDDAALARVEARTDGGALEALMASLPAAEREAVEARVLAEAEYAEIAQRLRCSEAVVRQRVSRGLRRLRKAMAEDGAG